MSAGAHYRAEQLFPDPTVLVGETPFLACKGDFNKDGHMDVATANYGSDDVSVILGLGGGLYAQQVRYPAGDSPFWIAVGDADGDGNQDLAVANYESADVSLLPGDGHGLFGEGIRIPAFDFPYSVLLLDTDRDGKDDLVVSNSGPGNLSIHRSLGGGHFAAPDIIPLATGAGSLGAADVNADGILDLAITDLLRFGTVYVLLGDGAGGFVLRSANPASNSPGFVDFGDFDSDGKADMAVAGGGVSIHLGNGDGTFDDPEIYDEDSFSFSLDVADFDEDGSLDLAIFSLPPVPDPGLHMLFGRGDGTFSKTLVPSSSGYAYWILAADFDADGNLDIGVDGGGRVEVLYGDGTGHLGPQAYLLTLPARPGLMDAGDVNGDGREDLIVPVEDSFGATRLLTLLGQDGGGLTIASTVAGFLRPVQVELGDLDNDGDLDAALLTRQALQFPFPPGPPPPPVVAIYLGAGDGSFTLRTLNTLQANKILLADFNGDTRLDMVGLLFFPGRLLLHLGNGDGTFGAPHARFAGRSPTDMEAGDFNQDGELDLVLANSQTFGPEDGMVSVLLGAGNGTFGVEREFGLSTGPSSFVRVADLDGDEAGDLVAGVDGTRGIPEGSPVLWTLRGHPDGTFGPPTPQYGTDFALPAIGDLNGDGLIDIAVNTLYEPEEGMPPFPGYEVLLNRGSLGFERTLRYDALGILAPFIVKDMNGDGLHDLVSTHVSFGSDSRYSVWVAYNRSVNAPPVAVASAPSTSECGSGVTLDASLSTDPDSAAGTQDDIAGYEWTELTNSGEIPLGTGVQLEVVLSKGHHVVVLRVTDEAGESATATVEIDVRDTTAPEVSLSAAPGILWPPDHRMVWVDPQVTAADLCGAAVTTLSVTSSEPEDGVGDGDGKTAPDIVMGPGPMISLRAERDGEGSGRIYTIVATATDEEGLTSSARSQVVVPHDRGKNGPRP